MRPLTILLAVLVVVGGLPAVGVASGTTPHVSSTTSQDAGLPANTLQADCSFPYSATDATGTEVTLDAEPDRVVTTQASAAQVMWDIGAREKVVGMPVREYTAYLEGSDQKTDVLTSDGFGIDTETVVSLSPDLVLVPNNTAEPATIERLRDTGTAVFVFERERTIDGIYDKIALVGRLTGECEGATETVEEMRTEVEEIRSAVEGRERPRVLYTFYNFTAGEGTFIDSTITAAGGQNVAAEAGISGFQEISRETVVAQDPQWVVVPSDAPFPSGTAYERTNAYRSDNRTTVDANLMNQPGPRVVTPMRQLAEQFHPDAFTEETTTVVETETTTTTTTTTSTPDQTTESGPGFGVGVALVALVGGALLARRRG